MERFLKIQPLTFGGVAKGALQPMRWVKEMEKAFEFLGCTEAQKLQCARYKLQHEAEAWWQTTKPILADAHPELTWELFKEEFFKNYFPSSVRRRKEVEFTELSQGPKSILEYQQMFEELFFFAPEHLKTDKAKARKFEDGLRPSIGHVMVAHKAQSYSEVVQTAKEIEDKQRENFAGQRGTGKRTMPFSDRKYNKFSRTPHYKSSSSQYRRKGARSSGQNSKPTHTSSIVTGTTAPADDQEDKCYKCDRSGHFTRECNVRRSFSNPRQRQGNRTQGRVFSATVEEAEANQDVVTGTVSICSSPTFTLFDSSATHSFVSPSFARRMGILPKKLTKELSVSTPTGTVTWYCVRTM
ncbi:uncharacterized protein LOC122659207 [Telopea speciosissima]|uniref:uncharacterized protein LOC122659207 n=1 Tax=Telopea speciosissima TaxID=54955 RepID=UPI001CC74D45|nr:uncharacterized protein LOC122659207 [Telopea speciosissima]